MSALLEQVNLRDAGAVAETLLRGAAAMRGAACRHGSVEVVTITPAMRGTPAGTLIATGDLHDNPLHLARLMHAAGMEDAASDPAHLTLHELIHGDRLVNGLDYSYRVLARVAHLKATFPERVHVLLANHEMAQAFGQQVAKEGVRCNEVFDEALDVAFGDDAPGVRDAVGEFVRAMPLAVRFRCEDMHGDVLCAHSLPPPELMERFDCGVLERGLVEEDYTPRRGSAHLMVWGRGQTPEQLALLAERWGVRMFILGHEKAEEGVLLVGERAVVLNSDHERGAYVRVDLAGTLDVAEVQRCVARLAG